MFSFYATHISSAMLSCCEVGIVKSIYSSLVSMLSCLAALVNDFAVRSFTAFCFTSKVKVNTPSSVIASGSNFNFIMKSEVEGVINIVNSRGYWVKSESNC